MRYVLLALVLSLKCNEIICAQEVVMEESQEVPAQDNNNKIQPPRPSPHVTVAEPVPRMVDSKETDNDAEETPKVPPKKLSAIFPASSVPSDLKDNWQQHLVEQFKTFRTEDVDDSLGANPMEPPSPRVSEKEKEVRTTQRKLSNGRDARFQGDFAFSGEDDVLDERTLLDVFGEAAKEFLTQRVIPDTDEKCRWDWRSVRCEPACECNLEGKWGDYHLGRACRLRDDIDETCVPVDPASIWQDTPATRRVLSLATQTADILRQKVVRGWDKALGKASQQFSKMQHHQCDDLWRLYQEHAQSRTCLPPAHIPSRSLPQRIMCGPVDFNVCEDGAHDTIKLP